MLLAVLAADAELTVGGPGGITGWLHWAHDGLQSVIENRHDELNMLGTLLLLVLLVCGWLYTSLTHSKHPRLMKIEQSTEESRRSIDSIVDTLQLIKLAHDNNVQCDRMIGEKLLASLAQKHGRNSECSAEAERQANSNLDEMMRIVKHEINEITRSPPAHQITDANRLSPPAHQIEQTTHSPPPVQQINEISRTLRTGRLNNSPSGDAVSDKLTTGIPETSITIEKPVPVKRMQRSALPVKQPTLNRAGIFVRK